MPEPAKIDRRKSSDLAALRIRRMVFDGDLAPGARINQDEVAGLLGISRIPLREALIVLEREGWVTIEPHRGAFVNALDERRVRDHYALYGLIYGFAVRNGLARDTGSLVERLGAITGELATVDDPDRFHDLTLGFHAAIVDAADSPQVRVVLRSLPGLVPGNFFTFVPGAMETERAGLAAIFAAVERGDAERAASEYEAMMRSQTDHVVRAFANRGLFDSSAIPAS